MANNQNTLSAAMNRVTAPVVSSDNVSTPTTISIPTITNLATIELDDDNFLLWSHQMEAFLDGQNLLHFADGTYPCPPASDPNQYLWVRTNKTLVSIISATLSNSMLASIVGCQTSAEIWSRIQEHFATWFDWRNQSRILPYFLCFGLAIDSIVYYVWYMK